MRLSKTAWLILGIGIFVIALGSLYWVYLGQRNEQRQLNDSLSAKEADLSRFVSERANGESQLTQSESELTQLESELTQATSLLNSTEASFPELVESIEYDEELFKIADDYNVKIISLTASEPTDEVGENITYPVTYFTVVIRGQTAAMLNFINAITTDEYFTTATVETVDMIELDAVRITEEIEEPSLAIIKLAIYGYKGE